MATTPLSPSRLTVATAVLLAAASAAAQSPAHLPDQTETSFNEGLGAPPEELDRSTPRRALAALLAACQAQRFDVVAHLLDLGDVPPPDRRALGAALGEKLCQVLAASQRVTPASLLDTPVGPVVEDQPTNYVRVATLAGPDGPAELGLRHFRDEASGKALWAVSRGTVSELPGLHRALTRGEQEQAAPAVVLNAGLPPLPAALALTTPRAAVTTFMALADEGRYADAARLLDLASVPAAEQASRGPRLARRLAMLLRRLHPQPFAGLSNEPKGAPEKELDLDAELVVSEEVNGRSARLLLARHVRRDAPAIWVFSADTVAETDDLYHAVGYGWIGDHLPSFFFDLALWGVQLWQWLGLVLALCAGLLFGWVASFVARRLLTRLTRLTTWRWDDALAGCLSGPLTVAFTVVGFLAAAAFLALAEGATEVLHGLGKLTTILAGGWLLLRLVDLAAELLLRLFEERGNDMGRAMIPVARKILKPILFVMVAIVALQNVGMNVGGLLAGLGIGGLAFALAAKDTLANVFGSVAIAFDRPFKVGDFIKVGDVLGTVDDVGLRSTRIRTPERTMVTIPNAQIADSRVENFTVRDRICLSLTLTLQYDTSSEQLRFLIDETKRYLLAHPRIFQEGWRVRFLGFGDSSLDVEVWAYVTTTDWAEFTGIREGILFDLNELVARAGAQLAYPSQTIYVGKYSHADAARAAEAAGVVAARRAAGELTLPDIPTAVRAKLAPTTLSS